MCVGGGGGRASASSLRQGLGAAVRRQSGQRITRSVFRPGDYRVQTGEREVLRADDSEGGSGLYREPVYRRQRLNSFNDYNKLVSDVGATLQQTKPDYGGRRGNAALRYARKNPRIARSQEEIREEAAGRISRIGGGQHFENKEGMSTQGRVALKNETGARKKARRLRSGMAEESNYRSSRGSRRKGTGLRIGGSGVSVPQ